MGRSLPALKQTPSVPDTDDDGGVVVPGRGVAGTADGDPGAQGPGSSEPAGDPDAQYAHAGSERTFTVSLEGFEGPFDLLLGLITKRKLDVTKVALAEVTEEFIAYVRTLDAEHALEESSNFVFVAATLLDMKLVQLLPGSELESEEDIAALEARDLLFARLLQYKAFKQIAEQMAAAAAENTGRFPRRPGQHPDMADLLPELVWSTTAEDLKALVERALLRQQLEPDQVGMEHLHAHTVNVREEMMAMTEQLRAAGSCQFHQLVAQAENRLVVVVRFLGLLELFRDRAVEFDQQVPLGELTVTWSGQGAAESALTRAAEEWDSQNNNAGTGTREADQ